MKIAFPFLEILRPRDIFTPIYKQILRISPEMYIYFESPILNKLSQYIKITIIAFRNKKLLLFFSSSFFSILIWIFSFYFFQKIMLSLILFQRYQIYLNWQSNIDVINKNKKCNTKL